MGIDAQGVLIGLAEQSATTGAIASGPAVATIPQTFAEAEAAIEAFTSSGYVSEDGLSMSTDYGTQGIREWNGNVVRTILEEFTGELSWTLIQTDEAGLKQTYGEDNVTVTNATAEHGNQFKVGIGAHLPAIQSWGFRMKDGDARIIVFVARGQVTAVDEINFNATEAIAYPTTLSCYDDGTGNSLWLFFDDGRVLSAQGATEEHGGNVNP